MSHRGSDYRHPTIAVWIGFHYKAVAFSRGAFFTLPPSAPCYSNFTNGVSCPHQPRNLVFAGLAVARGRRGKAAGIRSKKIGFAPASFVFPGTSIFGFGFKLALIGFGTGAFFLLLHPGIPPRLGINL